MVVHEVHELFIGIRLGLTTQMTNSRSLQMMIIYKFMMFPFFSSLAAFGRNVAPPLENSVQQEGQKALRFVSKEEQTAEQAY